MDLDPARSVKRRFWLFSGYAADAVAPDQNGGVGFCKLWCIILNADEAYIDTGGYAHEQFDVLKKVAEYSISNREEFEASVRKGLDTQQTDKSKNSRSAYLKLRHALNRLIGF